MVQGVEKRKPRLNNYRRRHSCAILYMMMDIGDFSVVVKNRGQPPKPWRWEIYRAGRKSPVTRSTVLFETVSEANITGKKALQLFLSECQCE